MWQRTKSAERIIRQDYDFVSMQGVHEEFQDQTVIVEVYATMIRSLCSMIRRLCSNIRSL